jgi:crotonobetainyl-CoA:carnitine CoA-transferase CaiB-like acyl-CoA transferase
VTLPPDASGAGRAVATRTALLPLTLGGERPGVRAAPPALGQHTEALLRDLGYGAADIEQLRCAKVIAAHPESTSPADEPAAG